MTAFGSWYRSYLADGWLGATELGKKLEVEDPAQLFWLIEQLRYLKCMDQMATRGVVLYRFLVNGTKLTSVLDALKAEIMDELLAPLSKVRLDAIRLNLFDALQQLWVQSNDGEIKHIMAHATDLLKRIAERHLFGLNCRVEVMENGRSGYLVLIKRSFRQYHVPIEMTRMPTSVDQT